MIARITGRWDTRGDLRVGFCVSVRHLSRAGQTGMNHMEISSEELRSLPPRPPLLPAATPKRRFARLERKTSDGPQK